MLAIIPAATGPRQLAEGNLGHASLCSGAAYMSAVGSYRPSVHDGIWRVLSCTQRAGNSRPFGPLLRREQATVRRWHGFRECIARMPWTREMEGTCLEQAVILSPSHPLICLSCCSNTSQKI